MKRILVFVLLLIFTSSLTYSNEKPQVELKRINDSIWVHISYFNYNGYSIPSNGIVAVTDAGLILIDTPWTNVQTQELTNLIRQKFGKDIVLAIITHAHQDRIGGIDTLLQNNIETISTTLTAEYASKAGYQKPQGKITNEIQPFTIGEMKLEVFYPGPAHTKDNIVVYFPDFKVLFGGCIVKAENSDNLGNISEGDPVSYPVVMKKLLDRYVEAEVVVPGHGIWGGAGLLEHTLKLAMNQ